MAQSHVMDDYADVADAGAGNIEGPHDHLDPGHPPAQAAHIDRRAYSAAEASPGRGLRRDDRAIRARVDEEPDGSAVDRRRHDQGAARLVGHDGRVDRRALWRAIRCAW